ncbi:hypothetical protein [Streptomyces sp. NPDC003077]|uniref:hypothetical protein n=1 Tax=Streptomyces sp. NPDC003077 TaxID=3154443 RepID=UPI0033ADCA0A
MSTELIVASVSGAVALLSAVLSVVLGARSSRRQAELAARLERQTAALAREAGRRDLMHRVRDPLLWAAFDLQSRIYNIARSQNGFLALCYLDGTPREREYARRNTLFVFAEYLGWVEILRRRVRFLDLGVREENREVVDLLHRVATVLNSNAHDSRAFRIFRGEQRAIGESVITDEGGETGCIGYAEFCRRLDSDPAFADWFGQLDADVRELGEDPRPLPRLVELQHVLMDLITFLDPQGERFPAHLTRRLPEEGEGEGEDEHESDQAATPV